MTLEVAFQLQLIKSPGKVPYFHLINGLIYLVYFFTETCDPFHDPYANDNILLSGLSGRFDGRSSHQTSMKCRWIITVPSGYRIKLSFQSFNLGPAAQQNCENTNHLMVRDSNNQDDPGFRKVCGDVVPSPFYSVGTRMMISFLSNNGTFLKAFEARFDAISEGKCRKHFSNFLI